MDDEELGKRLQAIEDLLGTVVVEAGGGLDVLDVRNELEDVERRLAGLIEETHESLGQLAGLIERVQARVDEIAGTT